MASIPKQSKWLNSDPIPPKSPEPSLSSEEESSTESLNSYEYSENSEIASENCSFYNCSAFVTQTDNLFHSTSVLSSRESILNIRQSLNDYRIKSASKIQKFFKAKKLKRQLTTLFKTLQKLQKKLKTQFAFKGLQKNIKFQDKAAVLIQKTWKNYKLKSCSPLPSPRRQMLARAVSIGGALIKIQNLIEKIVSRRSSPVSPNKKNNLIHKRSLNSQMRSKSFSINLIQSVCEDESDTQESKASTPALDLFNRHLRNHSTDSTWESVNEGTAGTLLMKRDIRVRNKKRIKMGVEELTATLKEDLLVEKWRGVKVGDSCIPVLSRKSRFWKAENFECLKNELVCEYKDLIKY